VDTSNSSADYIPNLSALARAGYDLVIGVGFLQEQAIQQIAKAEVAATLAVAKKVASGAIKPPTACSPNPNC
jgi:basic membrane lipoprotein Med (substrate-binding protein (PBP1-ABC) superfamily)